MQKVLYSFFGTKDTIAPAATVPDGVQVYEPNVVSIEEMKRRLRWTGVVGDEKFTINMIPSDVIDHIGRKAIVKAPYKISRQKAHAASKESIVWLEYMSKKEKVSIWHEENGQEVRIMGPNKVFEVDGYCPTTMTVYEYNGDHYHTNPLLHRMYDPNATAITTDSLVAGPVERYDKHFIKVTILGLLGFRVVTITEYEWLAFKNKKESKESKEPSKAANALQEEVIPSLDMNRVADIDSRFQTANANSTLIPLSTTLATDEGFRAHYEIDERLCNGLLLSEFRNVQKAMQYRFLRDITRERTIEASLKVLMKDMTDINLPFAFSPTKTVMSKKDYALAHGLACVFLQLFSPDHMKQRHWTPIAMPVRDLEMKTFGTKVMGIAMKGEKDFIRIFNKRCSEYRSPDEPVQLRSGETRIIVAWSTYRSIQFINGIIERMYGMKIVKTGGKKKGKTSAYTLLPPRHFQWTGSRYHPSLVDHWQN